MKNKLLFFGAALIVVILFVVISHYSLSASMIRDCKAIQKNQTLSEIEQLMSEYIDSEKVKVALKSKGSIPLQPEIIYDKALNLYTTSITDDVQCSIYFINDTAIYVEVISD